MKLWTSEYETGQRNTNSFSHEAAPKLFNIFDLILIGVGSSLAVGTSVLIGELIKYVTGPGVVVSICLAGAAALVAGLCFSEFGVQFFKAESPYSYSYCWGKDTNAFIFGWALLLEYIAGTASVAKGIICFTDALIDYKISELLKSTTSTAFPDVFPYFDYFSFAIIFLIAIFIAFGLKDSLFLKKLFTICGIILFVSVIIAGAFKADLTNWQNKGSSDERFKRQNGFAPFGGLSVAKGAAIAFYGFIGFDTFSFSGNEINERKKNLPLAIFATIFFTLVVFSGIGVILSLMLPYTELNSYAAVPFAFQHVGWIALKWVAVIAAFFGFQTSFFGVVQPLPKIIHAMANDGLLFYCLGNDHQRFKTPFLAVMTGGLLAAVGAGIFTFQTLVNLAVIGALFVYTVLAINVILLRYFPEDEDNEKESWKNLMCNNNSNVSIKAIIKNYFNFKEKQPTDLTKAIILGNLVLFCFCSVGFSIIFNVFYDFLVSSAAEAVVPASILIGIMFFNFTSICCQPKSQEILPFKVPLFPFIPCLSIFLNIFLMISFDSMTWILFSIWMIIGVIPYFFCYFLKCLKGELGKTSLYEINRTNVVKLNESIWKIKSDKKSFYEGAVNPVFSYDFDDGPNEEKECADAQDKKFKNKTQLQLKQDEIIQKDELNVEEKLKHLEPNLHLNFIPDDIGNNLEDENEKVQWECVAEIHTEEEMESVALEIVDNTYNFLSEVSEEMSKEGVYGELEISQKEDVQNAEKESSRSDPLQPLEIEQIDSENDVKKPEIFKDKTLDKIQTNINNKNKEQIMPIGENLGFFESNAPSSVSQEKELTNFKQLGPLSFKSVAEDSELSFCDKNQHEEKLVHLIVETLYEAHQGEMILKQNNATTEENIDEIKVKPVLDEQNKIKDFKEKLNQLLKNQINSVENFTKNFSLSKSVVANNTELSNKINEDGSFNNIQTLSKSQIKDKLELLLAKKHPVRPSLKNSFNISLNESINENKLQQTNGDSQSSNNLNSSEKEKSSVKPSFTLADSIKEKILSLKNVDRESSDIYC